MLDLDKVSSAYVSKNSKLLRKLAGFTQRGLAKAAGISVSTIARVETSSSYIYSQLFANSIAWACYLRISDDDIGRFIQLITSPASLTSEWVIADPNGLSSLDIFEMNLKKIRFRFGLSLDQLGALTGYNKSYAALIENGARPMTYPFMLAIDKALKAIAIDDPELMSWYDSTKRAPIIGDDPPKYSRPDTFHNL